MKCDLVRRHLDAYVDGEVDPTTQIEFERHLAECHDCREQTAFAQSMKAHVREHLAPVPAPDALRMRIHESLVAAEREASHARSQFRVVFLRPRYAIPAAAAAVVVMAVMYNLPLSAPQVDNASAAAVSATPIFEDVVRLHSAELPPDVPGEQPQKVTSYFRNKVAFPVRPAEFERRDARLVGARLSNVRERSAAALYYDVNGARVTVVVFDQPQLPNQGFSRTRMFGRELTYQQVHGYTVPIRSQDGIHYAFTGDLDRRSLLRLAASARVSQ